MFTYNGQNERCFVDMSATYELNNAAKSSQTFLRIPYYFVFVNSNIDKKGSCDYYFSRY